MTVDELLEALTDASENGLGDTEILIGIVTQNKLTRATIDDFAEAFQTEGEDEDGNETEEDRFWITVSDDRKDFYNVPQDLRNNYR
jgi:hypothetical protein